MSLRRFTGCAVMALLLASVALPAMCGACMDFAAKAACGERHDAGASASERFSMAMGVHCGDCGDRPGITAKESAQHASVLEFMFLDCARRICAQAVEQYAAIYGGGVEAQRLVGDRATFGVFVEIVSPALRTAHLNVFVSGKLASGNSAYQPLSVSLRI